MDDHIYQKVKEGEPFYDMIVDFESRGVWVCDSSDHNEDDGCSNPDCFKHESQRRKNWEPRLARSGDEMTLIVVDCEAPFGVGAPSVGDMTEFGAVDVDALQDGRVETFHGANCSEDTFLKFREWLIPRMPVVFVSDNPAYDFQWINFYFWRYIGENPFGHSGRRIADFYAGLVGNFRNTQRWKRLRQTKHDHNPVHDALGNAEALIRLFRGER
jgi:hypothetical protein